MKQFITNTVCVILLSPILVVMLIGYIPFAIFKGLTDNFAFSEYCNFIERITDFLKTVSSYIDNSIALNQRSDGLFHAYNLLQIRPEKVAVRHLTAMLEGQVAVLSSGYLNAEQAFGLLNALRNSALYRPDQHSYMLYPNKKLPNLLEINQLSADEVNKSALLRKLHEQGNNTIVSCDIDGDFHFNGSFNNAKKLSEALNSLNIDMPNLAAEKQGVLELYEKLFDHESFTGRSGTFYKYEGLGCIYWHMVSKLLQLKPEMH